MSNQTVKAGHCQCTKADVLAPPLLILVRQIDPCLATHIYAKINDFFFIAVFRESSRSRDKGYH